MSILAQTRANFSNYGLITSTLTRAWPRFFREQFGAIGRAPSIPSLHPLRSRMRFMGPGVRHPVQPPCTEHGVGTRQLDLQAVLGYASTSPSQAGSSAVCVLHQNHIPPRLPRWRPAREGQRSRPRRQMKHSWVRLLLFLVLPSAAHSVLVRACQLRRSLPRLWPTPGW